MSTTTSKIPTIYVDGLVPQTKAAAQQAVTNATSHVYLKQPTTPGEPPSPRKYISEMFPGDSVSYTDGKGKYYGRIKRAVHSDAYLFDNELDLPKKEGSQL